MLAVIFLLMNVIALFHAYKFTHFSSETSTQIRKPVDLTTAQKLKMLLFGINNPQPVNKEKPTQPYQTLILQSNKKIECWSIKSPNAKGTVVIFHGYGGNKSGMIDRSDEFIKMGYNTLLVDFMGSGNSEGNQTTIGFYEAEQVKTCFEYLQQQGEKNIVLFGTSMGAVAVLKAIDDYGIKPNSIILECPFGTMYQTVCARFNAVGAPAFPMAGLLMFWGGTENGFWAFSHNPVDYAKTVHCPALLLYGEKDGRVSRSEIDAIFTNFQGPKQLTTYPLAGHENYLIKYHDAWVNDVSGFLSK
ncbi:lysophospholipase [Flavobacterium zepuense]|uniref:Lysophospholipase n=2 Tax=Flavobacterium zepuense TaxID=2593302 RepID=A0A552V0L3_9FLAO|nr:lysophospholipase [Flavobacterium zepuense]